jgi:hypothetical protein
MIVHYLNTLTKSCFPAFLNYRPHCPIKITVCHTYKATHQIFDFLRNNRLLYISGAVGMAKSEDTVEMIIRAKLR